MKKWKTIMKLYDIIYADPPWNYKQPAMSYKKIGNKEHIYNYNIEDQYPVMTEEEILSMNIPAKKNALLFLWSTVPKLPLAMKVITDWGFTYRTHSIWDKRRGSESGMGFFFRIDHELLLAAFKGSGIPMPPGNKPSSMYHEGKGKHSVKPQYYRNMINEWFPKKSKIELFARTSSKGFETHGNNRKKEKITVLTDYY